MSLKKLVKYWAYCVDFNQSYQDHPYWLHIKHLSDFADVKACNSAFHEKLESLQTGIAYLAITGAIRGKTIPKVRVRIPKIETLV